MNLSVEFKQNVFELIKTLIKEFVTLFSDELISSLENELFDRLINNTELLNLSVNSEVAENFTEPEAEAPVDLSTNQHSDQQQRGFNLSLNNDDLEGSSVNRNEQVQEHQEIDQMAADDNKFSKMTTQATQTEPESALEAESELVPETEPEEAPLDVDDAVSSQTEQSTSSALPSASFDAAICEFAMKSEFIDEDEIVFIEAPSTQLNLPENESPVANFEHSESEQQLSNGAQSQQNIANLNDDVSHSENVIATTENTSGIKRKISHIESDDAHLSKAPKTNSTTPTIASTPFTETMPNNSASSTLVSITIAGTSNLSSTTQANLPKSNALAKINDDKDDDHNDDNDNDDDDELDCLYDRWFSGNNPDIKIIKIKCHTKNCQKLFRTKDEHEKHLLRQHNIQPFFCLSDACNMSFANKTEWKKHTLEDHCENGSRWKCRICSNYLLRPKTLFRHYISNHEEGIFACKFCSFNSCLRISTINHLKTQHPKEHNETNFIFNPTLTSTEFSIMKTNSLTCINCSSKFKNEFTLNDHLNNYHQFKPFLCHFNSCISSFNNQKQLIIHMKKIHKTEKCYFCNQTIASMNSMNLKHHTMFFHEKGQFQCTLCKHKPTMNTRFAFKKHCEQQHSTNMTIQQIQSNDKKMSCPFAECKTKFNFKEEMAQHLQNVHKISRFKCYFIGCNRNFNISKHLEYHIYTEHKFVKKWKCFLCRTKNEQTFSTHKKLRTHIHLIHFKNIFLNDYRQNDFEEQQPQSSNFEYRQPSNLNKNFNQSVDSSDSSQHQNVHLMTNQSSYQHQNVSSMSPEAQEAYLLELQQSFLNGQII